MITQLCLRWRERRGSWRPADELIRTSEYEVAEIDGDADTKAFVLRHHYSGTYPAARWRFGLFRRGAFVGAAVFSHPTNDAVLTSVFPGKATDSVELGRLVLLDEVGGNGESWFVARCLHQLRREGLRGVVMFSDPVPRTTVDGRVVMPGHIGVIYQALNTAYRGRGSPAQLHLLPDGRALSNRALSKLRNGERGWEYVARQLEAVGAETLGAQDRRAWLARWLPLVTRPLRHPGNHKYAIALHRRERAHLPSLPYPKLVPP